MPWKTIAAHDSESTSEGVQFAGKNIHWREVTNAICLTLKYFLQVPACNLQEKNPDLDRDFFMGKYLFRILLTDDNHDFVEA